MIHPRLPFEYLVREPQGGSLRPPLLILLHGYGSNEEDLFGLASLVSSEFLVISVRAPYTIAPRQYAWFHLDFSSGKAIHDNTQAEKSRLLLKNFIDEVSRTFAVDTKRIFLAGFSQGAIMSLSVALTSPLLVKGIAMLSGRILEEIKPLVQDKDELKQLKVFLGHGTMDTVLPIFHARDAKTYLTLLGVQLEYAEYPIAHAISGDEQAALVAWLNNSL